MRTATAAARLHERHVDDVFGNEPDLQLVMVNHVVDDQIARAIVALGVRVNPLALGVIKTPMYDPASYNDTAAVHPLAA